MSGQDVLGGRAVAVDLDLFEDLPRPAALEDLGVAVNEVAERLGEHADAVASLQRRREALQKADPSLRRRAGRGTWPEMAPPLHILSLRRVHARR